MIRQALVYFLKADADLNALVHSRIFPYVPEGGGYPRLTITRTSNRRWSSLAGPSGVSVSEIDITSWATTRDEAVDVAEQVKHCQGGVAGGRELDGYAGTITVDGVAYRVQCCRMGQEEDDEIPPTDGSESVIHSVRQPYTITWDEP